MLYSCTCRPLAVDWLLLPLKVNLLLFYLHADWFSRTTVPRSSDILDSWRTCAFRRSCMTEIFAYEIDRWWFFFSGAPFSCVSRPITFVFDLVRCVKICRSWDSTPRPLGDLVKRERTCPTVQLIVRYGGLSVCLLTWTRISCPPGFICWLYVVRQSTVDLQYI